MERLKNDEELAAACDEMRAKGYTECVTGDACAGDEVAFAESKFTGSYRRPRFAGYEVVTGKIVRDSYGAAKQQHTFTIELEDGRLILRKARNVYRNWTLARPRDAAEREASLADKHARGDAARERRRLRREAEESELPRWY